MEDAMKTLLIALGLAWLSCDAGTIYMCKAYNGGTFWAAAHCNQHNALIEQIVSVPDSLPFDQQVRLAEQQRTPAASSAITITTNRTVSDVPAAQAMQAECAALNARVESLDAQARHPQSAQMQDWIRGERKQARDRQFGLRCR
jgi:hypothetical protein